MSQSVSDDFDSLKAGPDLRVVYAMAAHGRISTTLNGALTATALSIVLTDGSSFPTSGVIVVEDASSTEYIYFESRSGNTLTVPKSFGRASLASSAAAHASGKTVRIVYVFTSAPIAGREANTDYRQDLVRVEGYNQKMIIEEGHAEVGQITFKVLDRDEFVTGILKSNDNAFRSKNVRFLFGFRDVPESEFMVAATLRTSEIKLDNSLLEYKWQAVDLQRTLRETITFGRAKLSTAITAGSPGAGGTITPNGVSGFAAQTYIRIDDEIIQVTTGASTFTVVARAALGTVAASHDADTDIEEVYVVEGNPITLLLQFMLTINGDGANGPYDALDSTKGLAISRELVDVAGFEEERQSYVDSRVYTFHLTKDTMGKFLEWAEQQILRTLPGTFLVKGNGQLSMRVSAPILAAASPAEIDEDKIIGNPDWELGARFVINHITVKYDHDLVADKFLTVLEQINASSAAKHGAGRELTIESYGIRTDDDGATVAQRLIDYFDHRFSEPAPEASMDIRMEDIQMEASDGILLSHEKLPDLKTGYRGLSALQMEISELTPNFQNGTIRVVARDMNRVGKYGMIAPTLGLEDTVSAFPDYTAASAREQRYAFICSTATEQMSNGDAPTLII